MSTCGLYVVSVSTIKIQLSVRFGLVQSEHLHHRHHPHHHHHHHLNRMFLVLFMIFLKNCSFSVKQQSLTLTRRSYMLLEIVYWHYCVVFFFLLNDEIWYCCLLKNMYAWINKTIFTFIFQSHNESYYYIWYVCPDFAISKQSYLSDLILHT